MFVLCLSSFFTCLFFLLSLLQVVVLFDAGTEESYNEVLAMQEEADREIDKATLQANELIVQLAASQQELRQLDKGMMAAVERRQNAKRELERRCLELETLKLRLGEVLGPDYKPNIT